MDAWESGQSVFRPVAEAYIGIALAVGAIDIHSLIDKLRLFIHHPQGSLREAVPEHSPIGSKPTL